ncbi:MAG: hypothetical protein OEZ34_03950 [Spirochaetia bacterium]|nr:hypothetical protein [Spirochaetia bacterium]
MIRLIFKELKKHFIGIFLLGLFWAFAWYYINENRDILPVKLSQTFLSLPDEGKQDPEKAYFDYIRPAEKFISRDSLWCSTMPSWLGGCSSAELSEKKIHLDIMGKACRKYANNSGEKPPHWLESIEEWNLAKGYTGQKNVLTVDPGEYWDENNDTVLEALEKLIQASRYAWEIPPQVRNDGSKKTLLVAEMISDYAKAVCRDDMGLIAWGDYIEFQELRAGIESSNQNPDAYRIYKYPSEKILYSLKTLKNNANYYRALKEYSAGSAPESLITGCRNAPLSLPCASPDEAIRVLNKMIYFSKNEDLPGIYLKLAKIYLTYQNKEKRNKTLNYLSGAEKHPGLKKDALVLKIRYFLSEDDVKQAYSSLARLKALLPNGGRGDSDYKRLARAVLMKDGRYKEADCFSEKAETEMGIRDHCKKLNR